MGFKKKSTWKKHKILQEQCGNSRIKVSWLSVGGGCSIPTYMPAQTDIVLIPFQSKRQKGTKKAVFQLLFCLLPHFHFSSYSCPGAVPLSSPQLSLFFHQLRERYERKANVLASHDASAGCGWGGSERRGPQRNLNVPLHSRDTVGGCTS